MLLLQGFMLICGFVFKTLYPPGRRKSSEGRFTAWHKNRHLQPMGNVALGVNPYLKGVWAALYSQVAGARLSR